MNHKNMVCNNCSRLGHLYHQCKLPITSFGIVLFRHSPKGVQFLMIRRKDSFGYIDFIRGKYLCYNIHQLQKIIDEMSLEEKDKIMNLSFPELWKNMWGGNSNQNRSEEQVSQKKFECIKTGISVDNQFITLKNIVDKSNTCWSETEWEFPKGRRNFQEKDLECALREFEEETGIQNSKISVVENLLPFDEIFIGSNHKCYKHKYFLAYMPYEDDDELSHFQKAEVSKLEWKTMDECLSSIRPYHLEKKQLLNHIHKMLHEYQVYA